MTTKTQQRTLEDVLVERWEQVSRKVAQLAEEFSPESFEFRPAADVRTCGDVLRHLAFWNKYVADSLHGKVADDTSNELPRAEYTTKSSVLKALKRSSEDAAQALRTRETTLDPKTAELVMTFVEHTCEHYGQLVVYGRLAGIVPPASRA